MLRKRRRINARFCNFNKNATWKFNGFLLKMKIMEKRTTFYDLKSTLLIQFAEHERKTKMTMSVVR
jgi:hypothetical protein